jgi:hypothetical protein
MRRLDRRALPVDGGTSAAAGAGASEVGPVPSDNQRHFLDNFVRVPHLGKDPEIRRIF